jgi:hypothetical protein
MQLRAKCRLAKLIEMLKKNKNEMTPSTKLVLTYIALTSIPVNENVKDEVKMARDAEVARKFPTSWRRTSITDDSLCLRCLV